MDAFPTDAGNQQGQQLPGELASQYSGKSIRDLYERASRAIKAERYQYWLNHSYLLGEQWVWYNEATSSFDELPKDPDRVRLTVNKIWPASRTLVSKATGRPLVFDVPPTGADDATVRAAMTSEGILNALVGEHKWEELREELVWATWKGGTGAIAVEWDPAKGKVLGLDPASGVPINEGDTVETVLTVADFAVEPGVKDAETARWWIKECVMPPEQVQAQFKLPQKPAADATAALTPFQTKLLASHAGYGADTNVELTRVLTYYERPNGLNEEGKLCFVVNDEVVAEAPWPFPFRDRLNLIIAKETRGTGRWTGATVMSAARSIQNGINQGWSSVVEHMKLAGNARLFLPASVIDMIQDLTDLPGELVPYPDGETPPQWTSPPQMPEWWIEQPMRLSAEMDTTLGIHDVSRGDAPGRVDSAAGIALLVEQDETPIGRLTKETAHAFGKVGHMVLEIYQENVVETRQNVIKTPGQPAETTEWNGGTLLGQVGAIVPVDAIMPRSRAQQLEFAKMAVQMGLITTVEEFARAAELPDQRDLLQALSPDVHKARSENHYMLLGSPEVPALFDDHEVHIKEHLKFMKGPRWRTMTPEQQEIFILHNQAHENFSAELLGRMLSKAMTSPMLAAAADANGAAKIPVEAVPDLLAQAGTGAPGGAPAPVGPDGGPQPGTGESNKPIAAATDKGKQIGNQVAMGRAAKDDFAAAPETVTGGIP